MEPVTVREWQLLLDAVGAIGEKLDAIHQDLSAQRVSITELQGQYRAADSHIRTLQESKRWRWEHVALPILIVVIAFLLPHFVWSK